MIKRVYLLLLLVVVAAYLSPPAYAARQFTISSSMIGSGIVFDPQTCDFVKGKFPAYMRDTLTCSGIDLALKPNQNPFTVSAPPHGTFTVAVGMNGYCVAGASGPEMYLWVGYGKPGVNGGQGTITQEFADPAPWSVSGCMVRIKEEKTCGTRLEDNEVATGIKKVYCLTTTEETGDFGGASSAPNQDGEPYSGGGDPPGGGTPGDGGGTTPGDGGGGTTPGDGGGGTTPGGGGTTPGDGGGTTPGDGTGGGGTTPGGGTGGGGAGTDFCEKHPGSSICQNSGVSGNCENFVCNGDAIQCAILRESHDANCKAAADEAAANGSGIGKLGKGVLEGNDPDGDKLPRPGNGTNISMPSLDQSGWLGGGECFADKTVYIQGREITIPFSKACGALIVLRYAIMIVAALASFKMLSGAIIRE